MEDRRFSLERFYRVEYEVFEEGIYDSLKHREYGFDEENFGEMIVDSLNELDKEKDFWKMDSCHYSNLFNILSMDFQIVTEAFWELGKVIENDGSEELIKLYADCYGKFKDLVNHSHDNFKDLVDKYD